MLPPVQKAIQALEMAGIKFELFDNVKVEPTDASFKECITFARNYQADAFLGMFYVGLLGM